METLLILREQNGISNRKVGSRFTIIESSFSNGFGMKERELIRIFRDKMSNN
jgi:hypothetical protein